MHVTDRENIFPMIIFWRAVESGEKEHGNLSAHTYTKLGATTWKMENLEQSTPDDHSGTYRISDVEEALPLFAMKEALNEVGVFAYLDHWNDYCLVCELFFLLSTFSESYLRTDTSESYI